MNVFERLYISNRREFVLRREVGRCLKALTKKSNDRAATIKLQRILKDYNEAYDEIGYWCDRLHINVVLRGLAPEIIVRQEGIEDKT